MTRPDIDISIYYSPSEDLYRDKGVRKRSRDYFDVVYFSPPYYQLELYAGQDQSLLGKWFDKTM